MKLDEAPLKNANNVRQSVKNGKITKLTSNDPDDALFRKMKLRKAPKTSTDGSLDELSSPPEMRPDHKRTKKTDAGVKSKPARRESKAHKTAKIAGSAKSATKATGTKKATKSVPSDNEQSSEDKVTSKIMSPDAKHGAKHTDELDHQEGQIAGDFCVVGELIANRFEIREKIRRGGFGQIYMACDLRSKDLVVLKVEELNNVVSEMEAHVLEVFQINKHCPKLYASGSTHIYRFVVMQLLGPNLSDLRRRCSLRPCRLSISSSFRVILECLKAVEGLHTLGYLHRSVALQS